MDAVLYPKTNLDLTIWEMIFDFNFIAYLYSRHWSRIDRFELLILGFACRIGHAYMC